MMKLLGSTKSKITKDNVPHLEITVVILVYCNVVNNDYQQDSRYFAYKFQKHLIQNFHTFLDK